MTSDHAGAGSITVSLDSVDGMGVVRIEDRLNARIDEVWSALTDPSRLASWYGEIRGELRVGGAFTARLFASGWEGTGRVDACEPPRRLVTVSSDPDMPFDDTKEVSLTPDGNQTSLVVEQRGIPLKLLWAYGAGLQIHFEDLVGHIAGRERADSQPRFEALIPRYQSLAAGIS